MMKRLLLLLLILPSLAFGQLALDSAAVTTQETATAATHVANVPSGCEAGKWLGYLYHANTTSRFLTETGWTNDTSDVGGQHKGVIWTIATGSEGATVEFDWNAGTAGAGGMMICVDNPNATPVSQELSGEEATEDPFTLDAGLFTGIATDSWSIVCWGDASANRTIVTLDSDLTLIGSVTGPVGYNWHCAYETGVTENSAISTDMNDSRDYDWSFIELAAAAAGGSSIAPIRRHREKGL